MTAACPGGRLLLLATPRSGGKGGSRKVSGFIVCGIRDCRLPEGHDEPDPKDSPHSDGEREWLAELDDFGCLHITPVTPPGPSYPAWRDRDAS